MPSLTLAAVGDISFAGGVGRWLDSHDPATFFEAVRPVLDGADLRFANHESVYLPGGFPRDKLIPSALWGPEAGLAALRGAGFDVLNLAQNHVCDAGAVGLRHTRAALEAAGFVTLGVGESDGEARALRVVERQGLRVGFLGYLEDSNWTIGVSSPAIAYAEREAILADIAEARGQVDVLVVSVHGDLEFMDGPSPPRHDDGRAYVDAGADLVLMHHPHVPQGIERRGRGLIAWSLGNFTFDIGDYQRGGSARVYDSMVLLAELSREGVGEVRRVPCRLPVEAGPPRVCEGAETAALAEAFAALDALAADRERLQAAWEAKALAMFRAVWRRMRQREDPDEAMRVDLWRWAALAENRGWFAEAVRLAWAAQRERYAECPPYHNPHVELRQREGNV